jgi:L-threonylcarbamoyladenylate synthase
LPLTRVLAIQECSAREIAEAAAVLRNGGLVAFPTESFYGLGADALNADAVARVFRAKGRPDSKPLLVLVNSVAMAETLVVEIPSGARELMARHWPGPLTLVLNAAPHLPAGLTAGTGTIGIRLPGHAVARALVEAARVPLTAPSANPSGAPPPTTVSAVQSYLDGVVDLILDGGNTAGGAGSTIADCTSWPPRVLRQGRVVV